MSTTTDGAVVTATRVTENPLRALLDPAVVARPHELLAQWRAAGPMLTQEGSLIISDYATCRAALKDSAALGSDVLDTPSLADVLPAGEKPVLDAVFFLDNPAHGRQRNLFRGAFTPRITARFGPWIREIADELFDGFAADGEFEGVHDLAAKLSIGVIARLLDVPRADIPALHVWSDDLSLTTELPSLAASLRSTEAFTHDELKRFMETSNETHAYFADLIFKRRRNLGEDLISNLIRSEEKGVRLTRREITNAVATVFIAGHESTTNLITNGLLAFSRHPDQFAMLRADPGLAQSAVEEVLRYDGPIMLLGRVARESRLVNGLHVDKDTVIVPMIAAGNRDERVFAEPDRFRIDRETGTQSLAFGAGAHFCLGSSLARLEAEIVFRNAAERLPDLHVDEDTLRYRRHVVVRGISHQRVTFTR